MTRTELKKLFPLEGEITKEILDRSNVHDIHNCPGANSLTNALQRVGIPYEELSWGATDGTIFLKGETIEEHMFFIAGAIFITTEEKVNFMNVKEPMKVNFVIYEPGLN